MQIDPELRKRYLNAKKARRSAGSKASHDALRAKGDRRLCVALGYAARGVSIVDAAASIGVTEGGLRLLLRRKLGSGAWPPADK